MSIEKALEANTEAVEKNNELLEQLIANQSKALKAAGADDDDDDEDEKPKKKAKASKKADDDKPTKKKKKPADDDDDDSNAADDEDEDEDDDKPKKKAGKGAAGSEVHEQIAALLANKDKKLANKYSDWAVELLEHLGVKKVINIDEDDFPRVLKLIKRVKKEGPTKDFDFDE